MTGVRNLGGMENIPDHSRRRFITQLSLALGGAGLARAQDRPKHILLRSSWQTVNIGDIAHTPGVLHILEQHLPDVVVTLWPGRLDNGVDELLMERFPKLRIATRGSEELKEAFLECDFLLHGSGPSLVAEKDVIQWHEETGKPFGVYGITLPLKDSTSTTETSDDRMAQTIGILSEAEFVFFRDSHSLAFAKERGCTSPIMEFGPDGAFACDVKELIGICFFKGF